MRLEPLVGDDPRAVLEALRAVLDGSGPALGLGMAGLGSAGLEDDGGDAADSRLTVGADVAAVVTTSGSTGVPKSVVLSRSALLASARATSARIGGDGAWLLALPASYVAGLQVLVRSAVAGTEPLILSGPFTPAAFVEGSQLIRVTARPTFTSLVPAQLTKLLDAAVDDPAVSAALRGYTAILIGGQALPAATLERAQQVGARIVRTYGSTETCGGCVYDGTPLDGVRVAIVDGEVRLSGATLADGYLGDPALTDAVFVTDALGARWYRTGDAGIVEDGMLRVRGRIDNVIVSGGINISLDRVERLVRAVPGLESAVVVGVPDDRWGEASVVVVARGEALRRSESVQLAEAREAVEAEIGAHARPSRLVLVDELAALPSGKPDRELIRRTVLSLH
jgi:o-succinylbenzoate---CoA ligase